MLRILSPALMIAALRAKRAKCHIESAMKTVVHCDEIVLKCKIPKKIYLTPAQKAVLNKAHLKAQIETAKIMRAHSMKVHAKHGL